MKILDVTGQRVRQDNYYNVVDNEVKRKSIYCHIEPELCGSRGGWTRLAYLNMSDDTHNCPSGFRLYQSGGVIELVVDQEQILVVYQLYSHLMEPDILRYVVE